MIVRLPVSYMLDRKARHAARVVRAALANGIRTVEPETEAQRQWGAVIEESSRRDLNYLATCTPGYYTGQGDISRGFFNDIYRGSEIDFWEMIDQWWESGMMPGITGAREHDEEKPA
ncbi:hypothetical protein [Saccharopolyspora pogona]|uniref:hypothetical protein n=1 Tax=Saccharopolyspora pogona TaxID=333966 RepID=UPI0016830733|nr:hypothetical protein [Saccharopolyspora pogona]